MLAAEEGDSTDSPWFQKNAKSTIKSAINRGEKRLWQRAWDRTDTQLHDMIGKLGTAPEVNIGKVAEIRLLRLRSGHTRLKEHMHKLGPNFASSPDCECQKSLETPHTCSYGVLTLSESKENHD